VISLDSLNHAPAGSNSGSQIGGGDAKAPLSFLFGVAPMKNKPKPDFNREIGRRLRLARITANIRQNRAAKLVGVTNQQIRNYEVGYSRVTAVLVAKLAQLYQRPVGWFLEEVHLGDEAKADPAAGLIERERIVTKVHDELSDRPG
jgi:transcriptional regulator with XRE-family HTH domain